MKRFDIFGDNLLSPPAFKAQAKRILNMTISVKVLLGFFVAMIMAVIFIGRSGHTAGVPVPGIELKLRKHS